MRTESNSLIPLFISSYNINLKRPHGLVILQVASLIRHQLDNFRAVSTLLSALSFHHANIWLRSSALSPPWILFAPSYDRPIPADMLLRVLQPSPAVLEIPSKDLPYDPSQDSILKRVKLMSGEGSWYGISDWPQLSNRTLRNEISRVIIPVSHHAGVE